MFIIKAFFTFFFVVFLLVILLGVSLWVKVSTYLQNPFLRQNSASGRDDNVIEGEYKVLDETHKN